MRWCASLSFLLFVAFSAPGQSPSVQDSIKTRLLLLRELAQSGNYERAQLEAEDFRWFTRRERISMPVQVIPVISGIYLKNKDGESAIRFLAEAESDARRERDLDKKAVLLKAIIKEYEIWETPQKALTLQRILAVTNDSLASQRAAAQTNRWRRQLDSLQSIRNAELSARGDVIEIRRDRAYALAGVAALIFLALLSANFMAADRWRKRLEHKELEWQLSKNTEREELVQEVAPAVQEAPKPVPVKAVAAPTMPSHFEKYLPPSADDVLHKIALIIEPNRQIVLYLKSLLSDHFEVETADNANEGLQMASELLPDIIVCDAVLNGKTGIDVIRQIKYSEKTNHIPVILLTDKSGQEASLDALRAGAEVWFNRPLLDVEMETQVKKLLGMRKVRQDQFSRALHLYFTGSRIEMNHPFLDKTLEVIEQNLPNPDFTSDELARKMHLSKTHFFRKLLLLSGKEPTQLIREMRLEKAKMLLEKRAAPVQTIAELVGFTNAGTFSLSFKEYFGENTLLLQQGKYLN